MGSGQWAVGRAVPEPRLSCGMADGSASQWSLAGTTVRALRSLESGCVVLLCGGEVSLPAPHLRTDISPTVLQAEHFRSLPTSGPPLLCWPVCDMSPFRLALTSRSTGTARALGKQTEQTDQRWLTVGERPPPAFLTGHQTTCRHRVRRWPHSRSELTVLLRVGHPL